MAERLRPRTQDLEVQVSSLARRVVSLDKELYSTYLSKSQLTRNTEFFALGCDHHEHCGGVCRERLTPRVLMCTDNILLDVTLRWTSMPSRGSSSTPRHASCQGNYG